MKTYEIEYWFEYKGINSIKGKQYYNRLPLNILSLLDKNIKERYVHLESEFGKAAIKGGFDPEKVSANTLEYLKLLKIYK